MRLLIVSQYFWPENFRINDLVIGLKQRGHEVTVLTGMPNYPEGNFYPGYGFFFPCGEDFEGIPVLRVPLVPRGRGKGLMLAMNFLSFAVFASLLAPWRCRGDFDVIFVYEPSPITVALPALLLKKIRKIPVVLWVQDLWPESLSATGAVHSPLILHWVGKLVRFIYRRCDRVLVQSEGFIVPVLAMGAAPGSVLYFPNNAEALYKPVTLSDDAPERAGMPSGFRVMFAGNIGEAQDFGTILSAAEKVKNYPDIHWLILGDGRMSAWVRTQITRRGLGATVHLLGKHPVESMPRYFSLADALLVTLKNEPVFSLTIPGKVQSYLACGKPIIAALDGEGARIVRESGAGLTATAENPDALAKAVLEMYGMSVSARQVMGERGLDYFRRHFERDMLLSRLDGWLKDLIQGEVQ
jgi:colanic acid biosynthesis glycosyl transferase WcaI